MPKPAYDHRIEFNVDAATYLALQRRADLQDRHLAQHLRHLVRIDLEQAACAESSADRSRGGDGCDTGSGGRDV